MSRKLTVTNLAPTIASTRPAAGDKLRLSLGRAGDNYYVGVYINGTQVRALADITAEQFAQLVTGQSITVDADVKIQ